MGWFPPTKSRCWQFAVRDVHDPLKSFNGDFVRFLLRLWQIENLMENLDRICSD